jgi:hypothetical protein
MILNSASFDCNRAALASHSTRFDSSVASACANDVAADSYEAVDDATAARSGASLPLCSLTSATRAKTCGGALFEKTKKEMVEPSIKYKKLFF